MKLPKGVELLKKVKEKAILGVGSISIVLRILKNKRMNIGVLWSVHAKLGPAVFFSVYQDQFRKVTEAELVLLKFKIPALKKLEEVL